MAGGLSNIFLGIYQGVQAQKYKNEAGTRPEYEIPDAIKSMMSTSQLLAAEGMPAEQRQKLVQDYERQMSGSLQGIADRKGGLTGVAAAGQQANDAATNIAVMDVNARQQNQKQLMQNQQVMGNYQDQEWMLNKFSPYQELMNRYYDSSEAASENITKGAAGVIESAASFGMGGLGGLLGGGGGGGTVSTNQVSNGGTAPTYNNVFPQGAGNTIPLFNSDIRLKTDITSIGTSPSGIPIYTFKYKGEKEIYQGVMAQELAKINPDAVVEINGYYAVDYTQTDVDFRLVA